MGNIHLENTTLVGGFQLPHQFILKRIGSMSSKCNGHTQIECFFKFNTSNSLAGDECISVQALGEIVLPSLQQPKLMEPLLRLWPNRNCRAAAEVHTSLNCTDCFFFSLHRSLSHSLLELCERSQTAEFSALSISCRKQHHARGLNGGQDFVCSVWLCKSVLKVEMKSHIVHISQAESLLQLLNSAPSFPLTQACGLCFIFLLGFCLSHCKCSLLFSNLPSSFWPYPLLIVANVNEEKFIRTDYFVPVAETASY